MEIRDALSRSIGPRRKAVCKGSAVRAARVGISIATVGDAGRARIEPIWNEASNCMETTSSGKSRNTSFGARTGTPVHFCCGNGDSFSDNGGEGIDISGRIISATIGGLPASRAGTNIFFLCSAGFSFTEPLEDGGGASLLRAPMDGEAALCSVILAVWLFCSGQGLFF